MRLIISAATILTMLPLFTFAHVASQTAHQVKNVEVSKNATDNTNKRKPNEHSPRRGKRKHTAITTKPLSLVSADRYLTETPVITIDIENNLRIIKSNDIPKHKVGAFPNRGNPHQIKPQNYHYQLPLQPKLSDEITPLVRGQFGIGVNGVIFEPGAAEYYLGIREGWRYEALGGAVRLGLDENHAHVQPNGMYHYHGLPTGLLNNLNFHQQKGSSIVGWAADGFPIYALSIKKNNGEVKSYTSSYALKLGKRPAGKNEPGGTYDGTFVNDYKYQAGLGSLDECNGTFVKTNDFPNGTYAYVLTNEWPVIPRCFKGKPNNDFLKKGRRAR